MSGSRIAFILTGSIAGYKACAAISQLVQRGHRVRPVATAAARRFVGEATLEGLTGERVRTDLFEPGAALEHIALTRWADLVVVCPATAATLNRLAAGLADDLAGTLFLAHDRRKAAVARLREWGVRFVAVGEGRTACGEEGEGRLAEPAEVVAAIEAALAPAAPRARILVTSGGTAERIDAVRLLTNASTGRTGAGIAAHLAERGHEVVLLRARGAAPAGPPCREETFLSFADLQAALARLLAGEDYDVIIHAAAVGDFGIESVEVEGVPRPPGEGKLDSGAPPVLRLRRHPKLIGGLRARSRNPALRVVAFKLTHGAPAEARRAAVAELFRQASPDLVVLNDGADAGSDRPFPAEIYLPDGSRAAHCADRADLGPALERLLWAAAASPRLSSPLIHAPLS
jgi:phosphopantothenoylcysteine decarboxylase/phosphopantothenate--cysteine ligase